MIGSEHYISPSYHVSHFIQHALDIQDPSWCVGYLAVEQFDLDGNNINANAIALLAVWEVAERISPNKKSTGTSQTITGSRFWPWHKGVPGSSRRCDGVSSIRRPGLRSEQPA
jgi:hypothetical protein